MTQVQSQTTQNNFENHEKYNVLGELVALRSEELIDVLNCSLERSGNKFVGPCPIHGGDNCSALNLYPEPKDYIPAGYWKCRTHHCENIFKKTIIGFARGVLSHNLYRWTKPGDKMATFPETIEWLCKFVGQDLNSIKIDPAEVERRKFSSMVERIDGTACKRKDGVDRKTVRTHLEIPAEYYLNRGYSKEVLEKYDVGLCSKPGREMYNRIVTPVYDNSGTIMIGCAGRSIADECPECKSYHVGVCPEPQYRWLYGKWKNSKNFSTGSCLYNYWEARKAIKETGMVVLVEGPGDIWRLVMAGVNNGVALFGTELTDEQEIILESSGAMTVVLLLDNDEPGHTAMEEIKRKLSRSYKIIMPKIPAKDVGDMQVNEIITLTKLWSKYVI
jgi:5S rRNA maturation endonuclease (ribonuclease M5)